MVLHLYILNKCSHHCPLCCNKGYSIEEIPVVTVEELKSVDTVCLTGGEPFLLDNICDFAKQLKEQYPNVKKIYVYSCGDSLLDWLIKHDTLHSIDGVSLSPKNRNDAICIKSIFSLPKYATQIYKLWSTRIYLFPNIAPRTKILEAVKGYENISVIDREWQKEFVPAPDSFFRRLPILLD